MATFIPGGQGITGKVGNKARLHVAAPEWGEYPHATDYWFYPMTDYITASAPKLLTAVGWIDNGTVSIVAGSGADFLNNAPATPDKGTPAHFLCNVSGERLTSPFVFGGGWHLRYLKDQWGWQPTKLIADVTGLWTTSSNADTTGGIGFVEAGGAIQTAADHLAMITSDGTDFILRSGAATSTSAVAVDTNPHTLKIVFVFGDKVYGYVDGVSIGSIAIETDLFPAAFGVATTSSNVLGLGATHIYYD